MKSISVFINFILLLAFATTMCSAQQNDIALDRLYLKDGSIYIGQKLSEDDYYYKFLLSTNDTITVAKVLTRNKKNYMYYDKLKHHKTKGLLWSLSIGINLGANEETASSHFEFLVGHRFNKHLSIAGGLGFEFNRLNIAGFSIDTQFSSYSLYTRYYINDDKKRFFVYNRIGYSTPAEVEEIEPEHSGGFVMQNGGGIHFASRRKSHFVLSVGYYMQGTEGREFFVDDFGNEISTEYDVMIRRLIVKFGMEF